MSTGKKQPQLELDELRQLKWLLGGALVLIALSSLLYLEVSALGLMSLGAVLVPLVLWKPELPARVPGWAHRIAFPAIVAYVSFDIYAHNEPLASMIRLDVLLLLYRSCHYRRRRDDLQLIVLGLFLVVMAGVVTVSMAFAVQIVAFVGCALLLLFVVTLVEAHEEKVPRVNLGQAPLWTRRSWPMLARRIKSTCDWKVFALGGFMFGGFVVLSGVLFMAIPRFQLDSGLALDRLLSKKSNTGFSDTLRFTDVTDIQKDDSVVLRIEASDRALVPSTLYWRMVVLDEYKAGVFQMSATLKKSAFGRMFTSPRIDGLEAARSDQPQFWTFYLESGVGRYLALAGGFRQLVFAEPQTVQWSPSLRLIGLSREPTAMTAYRVEGMNPGDRLGERFKLGSRENRAELATMLATGVSEQDLAVLQAIDVQISGGRKMSAEDFSEAAMVWLAKQHAYSLKSELPSGSSDPLVRWLASKEPGHCELFAGAFTLLARAGGYPARIVAGFMGGAWNEDYLVVRNSDAHAWCEIRTEKGEWMRADPTNDGPRLASDRQGSRQNAVNVQTMPKGWAARFDRLRMLWYRRVVNFDRNDQQRMLQSLKASAEGLGTQIRDWTKQLGERVRAWMAGPWDPGRAAQFVLWLTAGSGAMYLVIRYGRKGWQRWRRRSGTVVDPVRAEAGRWLQRGTDVKALSASEVKEALQRIRYGRRESWPEPARIFREARRAVRGSR